MKLLVTMKYGKKNKKIEVGPENLFNLSLGAEEDMIAKLLLILQNRLN